MSTVVDPSHVNPNVNTPESFKRVYKLNTFSFFLILNIYILKFSQKHHRTPSQAEISEFKELTKKDALQSLQKELNKLHLTAPHNETEVIINSFGNMLKF